MSLYFCTRDLKRCGVKELPLVRSVRLNKNGGSSLMLPEDNFMDQYLQVQKDAAETYEWNEERTALIRKENRQIVASLEYKKTSGSWIATNKSGSRSKKIGEYESRKAAQQAIDLAFGLKLNS